jgi:hypothetical protein
MYRYPLIALTVLAAFVIAACTDTPERKSPAAGSGQGGISRNPEDKAETKPAPAVEKGVVPDVLDVALEDAEEAIKEAGFKPNVEGGGAFSVLSPDLPVCEQDPAGGSEPPKKSEVLIVAERSCDV